MHEDHSLTEINSENNVFTLNGQKKFSKREKGGGDLHLLPFRLTKFDSIASVFY